MSKLLESMAKDKQCPKCESAVIFIPGGGWDYDQEFCSNRECDYEVEYDTSSYIED